MLRITGFLAAIILLATIPCRGENRFFFGPAVALTGTDGNSIEVLCDNDETA